MRLRRASLAVLVLTLLEYGIGMYVNLFVTIPRGDHGHGIGSAISGGPVILSLHIVVGLLLALGAIAVLVLAVQSRRAASIGLAVVGVIAMASASATGASFTSTGDAVDSMGMAVTAGISMLCFALIIYLSALRPERGN